MMSALTYFDEIDDDNDPELEDFLRLHVPGAARKAAARAPVARPPTPAAKKSDVAGRVQLPPFDPPPRSILDEVPAASPILFRGTLTTSNELIETRSAADERAIERAFFGDEVCVTAAYVEPHPMTRFERVVDTVLHGLRRGWEAALDFVDQPIRPRTVIVAVFSIAFVGISTGMVIGSMDVERAREAAAAAPAPMVIEVGTPAMLAADPIGVIALGEERAAVAPVTKKPAVKNKRSRGKRR